MIDDFFEDLDKFCESLFDEGLVDWADRIGNMVAGGATGGEILMGVRWALAQILEQECIKQSTAQRAEEFICAITQVIGDMWTVELGNRSCGSWPTG